MQDIPSFFIDQRIDQLSDERSIKRAYAKALKNIDQETELDAFQALRESYEYAVNWTRHRLWQEQQAASNELEASAESAAEQIEPTATAIVAENSEPSSPVPEASTSADTAVDAEAAWCDTIPLHPVLEVEPAQEAIALSVDDPVEVARSALQTLLARVAEDENKPGHAEAELLAMLDDERLINVEARDYFEWVLAGHLAQGWQPGNGDLFGAAVTCFAWNEDKYRILRFGDLGYHINNGLIELSAFNAQNPEAVAHQIGLIRRGRDPLMPDKRFIRDHILMIEAMVERYPTWLAMVSSRDHIQAWRDAADQYKITRVAKVASAEKSESFWSKYGLSFFFLFFFMISALRTCEPDRNRAHAPEMVVAPSFLKATGNGRDLELGRAFSLGEDHFFGRNGTLKDVKEAEKFWKFAAEKGEVSAQLNLGKLYRDEKYGMKDLAASHYWLEKAASLGTLETVLMVADDLFHGFGVDQSRASAYRWYQIAAKKNSGVAHYRMALMLEHGDGVRLDSYLAFNHLLEAARLGSRDAQADLGAVYLNEKLGQVKDIEQGLYWIDIAADHQQVDAMVVKANVAEKGLYRQPVDMNAAIDWYRKADRAGSKKAKASLAKLCKLPANAPACLQSITLVSQIGR